MLLARSGTRVRAYTTRETSYRPKRQYTTGQKRILVTGCMGQIGSELVPALRNIHGHDNVFATDIFSRGVDDEGPFEYLDILDKTSLDRTIVNKNINTIIHLSGVLSAKGETDIHAGMAVNIRGMENIMLASVKHKCSLFAPSSIAAFGPSSPLVDTPNECFMRPTTIYGIAKVYTENMGEYWHKKVGLDFRCLRYPGIISHKTQPGGGTTDWAVAIYHGAVTQQHYNCFLSPNLSLPMMYMPDCLKATLDLLAAPRKSLSTCVYNVTALSLAPKHVEEEIKKHYPNFSVKYNPDFREGIAKEWPRSLDDSVARRDWGWNHSYGVDTLTTDMLDNLKVHYQNNPAPENL